MKRKWNAALWLGFLLTLAGIFSYPFFVQFPATRDFPWVNFLLLALGAILLVIGLKRAFGQSQLYRGKVFGSILATLSFLGIALFTFLFFYELKQLPASLDVVQVGQKAPDFTLPDADGKPVALSDLISSANGNGSGAALLIFYRGFW